MIAGDEVKARQVANQLAIKDAIDKYKIGKVITFHKSVADAASFTAQGSEGIGGHIPGLAGVSCQRHDGERKARPHHAGLR